MTLIDPGKGITRAPPTRAAVLSMMHAILVAVALLGRSVSAQTTVDAAALPKTQPAGVVDSEGQAAAADVMALLPSDTLAVVVARKLEALDEHSSALLKRLELPTHPSMPLLATLGVMTGVDVSRAAAVALLATETETPFADGLVLLLPTMAPAAMIVMLEPKPVEDGFWRVSIRGRESYVGVRAGYAVFGARLATVKRVTSARSSLAPRLSARQRAGLDKDDLLAWFDASILRRVNLTGALDAWMQQVLGAGAEALTRYSDGCASARFDPDGLRLRFVFRPRTAEPTDDDSAALSASAIGLPTEPAALAVEVANGREGARGRLLLKWMTQRLLDGGLIDSTGVSELSAAFLRVADSVDVANLHVALSPEGGDGQIGATLVLQARAGVKAPLEGIQRLVETLAGDVFVDEKARLAMQRLQFLHAAETVAGIPVDLVKLDVSELVAVDHEAVDAVFGSDGLVARVGAVDGDPTIITLGGGSARFASAVAAVRSMRPAISLVPEGGVAAGTPSPFLRARVFPDQWLALRHAIGRLTGTSGDAPTGPALGAPVTLTMARNADGETEADVFLPADVIAALRAGVFSNRSTSRGAGR